MKESWKLRSPGELGRNRLLSWDRRTQGKDRTLVNLAHHRNRSAVGFRDFLHNGQPESSAAGSPDVARQTPNFPVYLEQAINAADSL